MQELRDRIARDQKALRKMEQEELQMMGKAVRAVFGHDLDGLDYDGLVEFLRDHLRKELPAENSLSSEDLL